MCGAGKTEVTKYFQDKLVCPKVYFGDATFERMRNDGLEINYENEKIIREKIRAEMGMGAYATLSLPKIKEELAKSDIVLVESMYSWSEYKILKQEFGDDFITVAVFASPQTRFERLTSRAQRPMKTYEEFMIRDYSEIENIEKGGPIARADYLIVNEGHLDEIYKKIDNIIAKINN